MPGKWPWTERHFTFDSPVTKYPDVLERLRGTPPRVEALTRGLSPEVLTRRDGETWSIQQNIGHLTDTEPLGMGRIDEILAGVEVMRAADMTNAVTFAANHNDRPLSAVLADLHAARKRLVDRLEALNEDQWSASAMHPRTKIRMRIIDLGTFIAEHDDYHLARITELTRLFAEATQRLAGAHEMRTFEPQRITRSYTMTMRAGIDRVFPLLCPVREHEYLDDWSATILYSESGFAESGCVFQTPNKTGPPTTWYIADHDPDAGHILFVMFTPESRISRLEIRLRPSGTENTEANFTYTHTTIAAAGQDFIAAFTESSFMAKMQNLEARLNAHVTHS